MLARRLAMLIGVPGLVVGLTAPPANAATYEGLFDTPEGSEFGFCTGPDDMSGGWSCDGDTFWSNCIYSQTPGDRPFCFAAPERK
jgi:hypothetical protein